MEVKNVKPTNNSTNIANDFKLPKLSINNDNVSVFSKTMIKGKIRHALSDFYFDKYEVGNSKGINTKTTNDKEDLFLSKNAERVANLMKTVGNCYTGTKHALLTSGVIKDYNDMPRGIASNAIKYFDKHPDKFQQVSNNGKPFTSEQLKKLPAGYILVYSKEGLAGHIAITNGNKQGMSDTFDNMMWLEEQGKGASCKVYKLTDGWQYNDKTCKLEFKSKK